MVPAQPDDQAPRNLHPILSHGLIEASALEQRATSQSLRASIGMNGPVGPEPKAGPLDIRDKDRSAVASATIWVASARHWLTTPWRVPPKEATHARHKGFEGIG